MEEFSRFESEELKNFKSATENYKFSPVDSTTSKIKENDQFSQVFNVLLNYWEIKPTQYEAKLQELVVRGIQTVSSFVPWAHMETDIYHSLKKFIKAAWALKLKVRVFVMPELGVNYPNAGIPRDLLNTAGNLAVDRVGNVIYNFSAPNIFSLPSFSSPEILKRFGNYLIKIGSVLTELNTEICETTGSERKGLTPNLSFCEVVISNSLFNYYRSFGLKPQDHGDYAAANVIAFRDFLDREYRPSHSGGALADFEQFKMQLYEGYNRHRFATHVEKLLREKTNMVFSRKQVGCSIRHIDLFNADCAVETAYQNLLTEMLEFRPSLEGYYRRIALGAHRREAIYLSDSSTFRKFTDQEKSFLILAALVLSGEVATMAEDLLKLSQPFQRKLKVLTEFLGSGDFVRQIYASYLSPSKFAMEERSFYQLSKSVSGAVSVITEVEKKDQISEKLLFVDPKTILKQMEFIQLLALAQSGKVVVMPLPMKSFANYTLEAKAYYEKFRKGRECLRLNIGMAYEVFEYNLGYVVFYSSQGFWKDQNDSNINEKGLEQFFKAMLGLSEAKSLCKVNDERLNVVTYLSQEDPSHRLVFILNPNAESVQASLIFANKVTLLGLPQFGADTSGTPIVGTVFELAVPPLGVLTMQVVDSGQSDISGEA